MLFKVGVLFCFFALTRGCEIQKAFFRVECYDSSPTHVYAYSTLRSSLADLWKADIDKRSLEITNKTREEVTKLEESFTSWRIEQNNHISQALEQHNLTISNFDTQLVMSPQYVGVSKACVSNTIKEELSKLQVNVTNWMTEREYDISQVLARNSAIIMKQSSDIAGIVTVNTQIQNTCAELKQTMDDLKRTVEEFKKSMDIVKRKREEQSAKDIKKKMGVTAN